MSGIGEAGDDMTGPPTGARSPLELLEVLATQDVEVAPGVHHVELYTMRGLLTLLWHGPRPCEDVVLACSGAMGSLLGPADGLYHHLGHDLASQDIATIRVGYRRPADLGRCVHDLAAAAQLAVGEGARHVVTVGHSFGGAVAVQAGIVLGRLVVGVVTLATQSAGCEVAEELGDTPLLLVHGEHDELLPPETSFVVRELAGHGDVVLLPATGHLLRESGDELRALLRDWIPDRFADARA
ncbi:MAG TPA: hypothetical protein VFW74_16305 [Acidimicrobiia bacterium]|nr:hypothetical protein [Acidimicrobiia bacterium]